MSNKRSRTSDVDSPSTKQKLPFSGIQVFLSQSASLPSTQMKIFNNQLVNNGAKVDEVIGAGTTHVVLGPKVKVLSSVKGYENLGKNTKVVTSQWVMEILKQKSLVDEASFLSEAGEKPASPPVSQVAPIFAASKSAASLKWNTLNDLVWHLDQGCHSGDGSAQKVAAFDIDYTLVKPKGTAVHPKDAGDFEMWHSSIVCKLQKLVGDGYRIVLFTNQMKAKSVPFIKERLSNIARALSVPLSIYVSVATSGESAKHRKPNNGMWIEFLKSVGEVDKGGSFFCGDAAGRPKDWKKGKKKDFSDSDRQFAYACGLPFFTPEEYFLGEAPAPYDVTLDISKVMKVADEARLSKSKDPYHKEHTEMVIMVGPPGSGKSTFSKKHFIPHGYAWVNRDTLGTQDKCLKRCDEVLKGGQSCIVDNTSPRVDVRAPYLKLAKKYNIPVRCFHMEVDKELAMHMNNYRHACDTSNQHIPPIAYHTFYKTIQPPTRAEGFSDIVGVQFTAEFASDADRKAFMFDWTGKLS